jgi:hypothetical protein
MAVLTDDHETLDDAVDAVFEAVSDLVAERASFVVVGQLAATKERLSVPPSDPEAIKVALGLYSTEGDARSAAESLWHSTASGDTFRVWWLPLFHGTPAELHKKQKEKYIAAEAKRDEQQRERLKASIAKRQAEMDERARQLREGSAA